MTPYEVREALETFRIIMDTREHQTPEANSRRKAFGVPVERKTLLYGDYCADVSVFGNTSLFDGIEGAISPACVIERKMSLDELAGCFTRSRDRFRREFDRAAAGGAKVYLLVEGASWEAIANHRYRSRFNPAAFQASLVSWMIRYDFTPIFCRTGAAAMMIKDILYRDMKARLENGEYG